MKTTKQAPTKNVNIVSTVTCLVAVVFVALGCNFWHLGTENIDTADPYAQTMCVTDHEYYAVNDENDQDYNNCILNGLSIVTTKAVENRMKSYISFIAATILFAIALNKK